MPSASRGKPRTACQLDPRAATPVVIRPGKSPQQRDEKGISLASADAFFWRPSPFSRFFPVITGLGSCAPATRETIERGRRRGGPSRSRAWNDATSGVSRHDRARRRRARTLSLFPPPPFGLNTSPVGVPNKPPRGGSNRIESNRIRIDLSRTSPTSPWKVSSRLASRPSALLDAGAASAESRAGASADDIARDRVCAPGSARAGDVQRGISRTPIHLSSSFRSR